MVQSYPARQECPDETFKRFADDIFFRLRVSIPAIVTAYDATRQTITAQPLIMEKIIDRDTAKVQTLKLPLCPDVPVVFPQAGDFVLTMPVTIGDECLLIFSDLNIDSWWENGGVHPWADRRRHDLSDAIAIFGLNNRTRVIPDIATDKAELRSRTGTTKIGVGATAISIVSDETLDIESTGGAVNITSDGETNIDSSGTVTIGGSGSVEINAADTIEINATSTITINGDAALNIHSTGAMTIESDASIAASAPSMAVSATAPGGTVVIDGYNFKYHTHPDPVSGNTGPVN